MVVVALAASSVLAGLLLVGTEPLVGLTGQSIPTGRAVGLVLAAWASVLPPALGFTALALLVSVVTRNGPAGVGVPVVLALGMALYALVDGPEVVRLLLLSTPFSAWHGLLVAEPYVGPLVWGFLVSLAWILGALGVAYAVFARREITVS